MGHMGGCYSYMSVHAICAKLRAAASHADALQDRITECVRWRSPSDGSTIIYG